MSDPIPHASIDTLKAALDAAPLPPGATIQWRHNQLLYTLDEGNLPGTNPN